ncbi:hypothetical protein N7516_011099 [Penicillium verrucosum]|uniref:uncharacterized protein n=1 Tax=Penicillium verrucosum TaxID=60171 RepID=UPI002545967A|nr:uncharacterized protein N7516_011099 [Penicillium verrucosum]KAJ5920241.1 hypothetical protein N7516_011099 [Penicillium verrucosum]
MTVPSGMLIPVWNVDQSVRTTSGLVLGHSVRQKPPTSPRSYMYPATISTPKQQYRQSTAPEPSYSPSLAAAFASEVYPASEHLLTLNVWTKPQTGKANY